ncbi:hypothetical protein Q7P37_009666 [Cladosporium fusiforme]
MTQSPPQGHSQPPSFKLSPTLTSYNLPAQTWLSTNNKTKEYANLATACAVFHPTKPTPHLLILQRASHDSMPNKWELPGGAVDATDETVLHGAARELFEEAGLRARSFSHIITEGPNEAAGQCFPNRTLTKMFCRFTFGVEAEVDGNGAVEVRLDPNEHQDFVWATEEDALNLEINMEVSRFKITRTAKSLNEFGIGTYPGLCILSKVIAFGEKLSFALCKRNILKHPLEAFHPLLFRRIECSRRNLEASFACSSGAKAPQLAIANLNTMSGLAINPKGVQFNPDTDIPDLAGRVIFITGGTAGIGKTTILSLAKHGPKHIVFTGRNSKRADEVIAEARKVSPGLSISFLECDQSSLESVAAVAHNFLANFDTLDILFANAGVMALPPGLTKDGYEVQFGTNHMGHALLLKYLLPLMVSTASTGRDVRLVTTTSSAFQGSYGIAYDTIKTTQNAFFGHFRRYMQSKLANTLYAQKVAQLYPEIMSCSVQPGAVATDIGSGQLGMLGELLKVIGTGGKYLTSEEGAYNMCWVATTQRENLKNGAYYEPVGWLGTMTAVSKDQVAIDRLWDWTQQELGEYKT